MHLSRRCDDGPAIGQGIAVGVAAAQGTQGYGRVGTDNDVGPGVCGRWLVIDACDGDPDRVGVADQRAVADGENEEIGASDGRHEAEAGLGLGKNYGHRVFDGVAPGEAERTPVGVGAERAVEGHFLLQCDLLILAGFSRGHLVGRGRGRRGAAMPREKGDGDDDQDRWAQRHGLGLFWSRGMRGEPSEPIIRSRPLAVNRLR